MGIRAYESLYSQLSSTHIFFLLLSFMVDETHLFQLSESVKECFDGWAQQQLVNTNMEQKLLDLTELLQTVIAN